MQKERKSYTKKKKKKKFEVEEGVGANLTPKKEKKFEVEGVGGTRGRKVTRETIQNL